MGAIDFATKYKNARERIFDLLGDLRFHSWKELEACGGVRYGARLLELKRQGWNIIDAPYDDDGQAYRLVSLEQGQPQPKRVRVYLSEFDAEAVMHGSVTLGTRAAVREGLGTFKARKGTL